MRLKLLLLLVLLVPASKLSAKEITGFDQSLGYVAYPDLDAAKNYFMRLKTYHEGQLPEIQAVQNQLDAIVNSLGRDMNSVSKTNYIVAKYLKNPISSSIIVPVGYPVGIENLGKDQVRWLHISSSALFYYFFNRNMYRQYELASKMIANYGLKINACGSIENIEKTDCLSVINKNNQTLSTAIEKYKQLEIRSYFLDLEGTQYNIFSDTGALLNYMSKTFHKMDQVENFIIKIGLHK